MNPIRDLIKAISYFLQKNAYGFMDVCVCIYIYIYIYAYGYIYIYICIWLYIYKHTYIHIYMNIYIYTRIKMHMVISLHKRRFINCLKPILPALTVPHLIELQIS